MDYLIPCDNLRTFLTWSSTQKRIKTFTAITKTFESSFFPHCAETWGNLSEELRNINSINTFKSCILNFVRPRENSVFEVHDINGVKLLTHLRLDFSHLNEDKFWHNFNDIINHTCSYSKEPETTNHYQLHCSLYLIYRLELLNDICALNKSLKNLSEENLLKILLYGVEDFTSQMNSEILKSTIKFIKKANHFSGPRFLSCFFFPFFPSSMTKYSVFSIFLYVFYVPSMYRIYSKRDMSSVSFVSCGVLFYLLLYLMFL